MRGSGKTTRMVEEAIMRGARGEPVDNAYFGQRDHSAIRGVDADMRQKLFSVTIKDCEVETFRSGGKGGQNQNKRDTGVRVRHVPSGAVAESRDTRSQGENKQSAFRKMAESQKFQLWAKIEAARRMGQETLEDRVERAMQPKNLLVEAYEQDKWVTIP